MTNPIIRRLIVFAGALAASIPGVALAADRQPLRFVDVFLHAAATPKLIMIALAAAAIGAVIVAAAKLVRAGSLAGGSVFVSALRFGGPAAGIFGGAYTALNMALGLANVTPTPPLSVLAPGFAEIAVDVGLGFAVGVLAIVLNTLIEARIDRQVLAA
jgi:hypothetical protein